MRCACKRRRTSTCVRCACASLWCSQVFTARLGRATVFDDWLPNVNEKMCFNCVIRRLHIRFRKFNCFYFGSSPYDSIILISNLYLEIFFLSFFRSLIIMCSNRSTFIYCLLKIYMLQTPREANLNEMKWNEIHDERWTQDAVHDRIEKSVCSTVCIRPNWSTVELAYTLESAEFRLITREFFFRHSTR